MLPSIARKIKSLSKFQADFAQRIVFLLCLAPALYLVFMEVSGRFGPDPVEVITHVTGIWSLRLLLCVLLISPLTKLLGWSRLNYLRRTIALYGFFYACLHFLTYLALDQCFDFDEIVRDISKRKYITAGFLAFILMVPLAVTSTNGMMKKMGRNWKLLHRMTYVVAILAVFHFLWLVKKDITRPAVYALILAMLLSIRIVKTAKFKKGLS